MAVPDPNVLNRFVLSNPAVTRVLGAAITAVSAGLSMVIARYFFKSNSSSGLGYLIGLPVGFLLPRRVVPIRDDKPAVQRRPDIASGVLLDPDVGLGRSVRAFLLLQEFRRQQ
jgi:hypothetical protein